MLILRRCLDDKLKCGIVNYLHKLVFDEVENLVIWIL